MLDNVKFHKNSPLPDWVDTALRLFAYAFYASRILQELSILLISGLLPTFAHC